MQNMVENCCSKLMFPNVHEYNKQILECSMIMTMVHEHFNIDVPTPNLLNQYSEEMRIFNIQPKWILWSEKFGKHYKLSRNTEVGLGSGSEGWGPAERDFLIVPAGKGGV